MATVDETNSSLATKCLAFCQALSSQGKAFQFSLNIGSTFSFTLDTRCKDTLATKKKASPSTLRRNAKRMEDFLKKKNKPAFEQEKIVTDKEETSQSTAFQCDQCDNHFKTESGLKIHIGKSHKLPPIEHVRDTSTASSLTVSPIKDSCRSIPCNNCGEEMSPSHICIDVEDDPDEDKDVKRKDSEIEEKCAKAGCCHCHHPIECECWREGPERDCGLFE